MEVWSWSEFPGVLPGLLTLYILKVPGGQPALHRVATRSLVLLGHFRSQVFSFFVS